MKEGTKQVVFRGTEREKAFIEARFSSSGEKYFNDFFKKRVMRLKIYTVSDAPIDDLANELKKATDYINAMAKYSNQGGVISLEHLIESIENLKPYEEKLKEMKEKLSPLFAKYPSRRIDDYKKYEEIVFDGRQRKHEFRARFTLEEYEKLIEQKKKAAMCTDPQKLDFLVQLYGVTLLCCAFFLCLFRQLAKMLFIYGK